LIELRNLNELLGSDGVTGLKTGFTEGAGGVLVTSKVANGRTFIIVVMKSDDRFADTKALLQLVDSGISYFQPAFGISF
jgi:D-alanyl-D-alanine carboxypeptidase (penicillin-binding protein 5/6)